MIIIENIVFTGQKIGGISVVWYELISRLVNDSSLDVKFIEYRGGNENILRKNLNIPSSKLMKRNSSLIKIRRFLNVYVNCPVPFIFHSSIYRVAKDHNAINFITVHDFIYFLFTPKSILNRISKWIHCFQMRNAIRKADYIICISKNTKYDLMKYVPNIDEKKISVIYNGVSDAYFQIADLKNINLPFQLHSYILFVGSRSEYKNFKLAVKAISKTGYSLVIIGKKLTNEETMYLEQHVNGKRYYCFSNVDNVFLNQLYNGAFCLLYPSAYEGFGIPIIEAQKAGCPVIAYNASSVQEIIGNTPLLINDLSVENIHHCLDILKDSDIRSQIIKNGLNNSKQYSWNKTYEQIKELYVEALTNIEKKH